MSYKQHIIAEYIKPVDEDILHRHAEEHGWKFVERTKIRYDYVHEIEDVPQCVVVERENENGILEEKTVWKKGKKTRILGEYNDTYVNKKTGFIMSCAGNYVPVFPENDDITTRTSKDAPIEGHFPTYNELHYYMHGF